MSNLKDDLKDIKWEDLPKETREFTSFLNLIIDERIESGNEDLVLNLHSVLLEKMQWDN